MNTSSSVWLSVTLLLGLVGALLALGDGPKPRPAGFTVEDPLVPEAGPWLQGRRDVTPPRHVTAVVPPLQLHERTLVVVRVGIDPNAPRAGVRAFVDLRSRPAGHLPLVAEFETGEARIEVPGRWFVDQDVVPVLVGVAGPGVKKKTQLLELTRGRTTSVSIALNAGERLEGEVVDEHGVPIPGLLLVAGTTRKPAGGKARREFETDEVLFSAVSFHEGRATTDSHGSFSIGGLEERRYIVSCVDPNWYLDSRDQAVFVCPAQGLRIVARRTRRCQISVRDAVSGAPLEHAMLMITRLGQSERQVRCPVVGGEGDVVWPLERDELDASVSLELRAKAMGYRPLFRQARIDAGERLLHLSIEMQPVPMGSIDVFVHTSRLQPGEGSFTLYAETEGDRLTLPLTPATTPGHYTSRLPVGSWQIRVSPSRALLPIPVSWQGHVDISSNERARAEVVLPAYGSLVVDRGKRKGVVLKLRMDGESVVTGVSDSNWKFPAVPPGEWSYEVSGFAGVIAEGVVTIRPRERTTLAVP